MTNVYLQELPPIKLGGSSLHYDIKNYSFTGEKLTTLIMLIPPYTPKVLSMFLVFPYDSLLMSFRKCFNDESRLHNI